ncbi:hypothetical protein NL676_010737 [Syzygium grande]|nr:hypothetical protein NL676_010737 [Syzygium grande]
MPDPDPDPDPDPVDMEPPQVLKEAAGTQDRADPNSDRGQKRRSPWGAREREREREMAVMEKLKMFVVQEPVVTASCLIAGVGNHSSLPSHFAASLFCLRVSVLVSRGFGGGGAAR